MAVDCYMLHNFNVSSNDLMKHSLNIPTITIHFALFKVLIFMNTKW